MTKPQAILVMESRGLAPTVRHGNFSDLWSRLYRFDDYLLDISCTPLGKYSQLQGKLLTLDGLDSDAQGRVNLQEQTSGKVLSEQLDETGLFDLEVEQTGSFMLSLDLAEKSFQIAQLDIA